MKTGIFGGTFDPIHTGHLELAHKALERFGLGRVLFIPARHPPHKQANSPIAPAPFRYRMVEMAIQDEPRFEISDVEFNRPEISYTVDTLRELRRKYPEDELYLIVGADSVKEMPTWREPEEIERLAKLIAARRPGFPADAAQGVNWIEMDCPLSSSALRAALASGHEPPKGALPEKVAAYIRKMNLYKAEP